MWLDLDGERFALGQMGGGRLILSEPRARPLERSLEPAPGQLMRRRGQVSLSIDGIVRTWDVDVDWTGTGREIAVVFGDERGGGSRAE